MVCMDKKITKKSQKITKKCKKMQKNTEKIENFGSGEEILNALKQRAIGYKTNEIIEEYSLDENANERLVKKKVTIKNVPPDISAAKVLLEFENSLDEDFSKLSNQELDEKINEIITKLKESENDN